MKTKLWTTIAVIMSALMLPACQLFPVSSSEPNSVSKSSDNYESKDYGHENIITLVPDIPDSDGDGVLDDIDECPDTPLHTVVNNTGCTVVFDMDGLEMEFHGFFPPMSSQLPPVYKPEFAKIAEKLNEYPDANVFIFGHVASNEVTKDSLATFGFESLPRNRALIVKNMLVLEHNIASERIHTYDCSNKYLAIDTDTLDRNFEALNLKNIESKDSRVTLLASTEVNDLMDLEYVSYTRRYGEYAKRCDKFE